MNNIRLLPYLNFDGKTREAMEFYKSCLGGTLTIQSFGEAPIPSTPETKDRIMHAVLESDPIMLMASDTMPEMPKPTGNSVHLSLVGSDEAWLKEVFKKLSASGTVTMPLEKQFWGDIFGMLTDKFGMHWMVNIGAAK